MSASVSNGSPQLPSKGVQVVNQSKMNGDSCKILVRVVNPNMHIVTGRRQITYTCSKSASELQSFTVLILQWMRLTFRCISLALWTK